MTNYRALCRRGVLWIGQTCNLRCHFCYFLDKIMDRNHPEHDFFELDKLKAMCKTLVDVYGNNSVDIQGGEPTIYRHITQLIQYLQRDRPEADADHERAGAGQSRQSAGSSRRPACTTC